MAKKIATCYEVREVWNLGCTSENCPLKGVKASPRPCIERTSAALILAEASDQENYLDIEESQVGSP
jgi:hypothetical protein